MKENMVKQLELIQQPGRGLRKAENKEYVVVLDFIGKKVRRHK